MLQILESVYHPLLTANFRMHISVWLATVGFRLDTDEGGSFLPGFVEALIGIQNDESRSFDLTFPPTWEQESLRGLQARFTVDTNPL